MKTITQLLGLIAFIIWFIFLRPSFLGGPASFIMISGFSMEPTMFTGDLAVLLREAEYVHGDIIAFKAKGGNVIHRIVGGSAAQGFQTQGDNKEEVDPWMPKPDEILGKVWFHIPGAGQVLNNLRQPLPFAALVGMAAVTILDDGKSASKKKRGRRMKAANQSDPNLLIDPSDIFNVMVASVFLGALLAAAAVYSFLQPLTRPEQVEQLSYEHQASFRYLVHTAPSILYPNDLMTSDEASQTIEGAPVTIFTRLARSIDLDFTYQLKSQLPVEAQGALSFDLQIIAGDAWKKTTTLSGPVSFSGSTARSMVSLDISNVEAIILAAEEQTGFSAGRYDLVITPQVNLQGKIGGHPLSERYLAPFTMQYSQSQIILDPELIRAEQKQIVGEAQTPAQIKIWRWAIPVATARLFSLAGTLLCLSVAGLLAVYLFWGKGEHGRLQAQYGSLMINVAAADLGDEKKFEVASIQDLVRLAKRDGRMILHQARSGGAHLYFIPDGSLVYTYSVGQPAGGED